MKIDKTETYGFEAAIRGMRNPLNSWYSSDSGYIFGWDNRGIFTIGNNDIVLAQRLIKAGTEHSKFLRFITVWADWELPLYVWKEADTYKFIEKNSCSTMHSIHKKPFELSDFETDALNVPVKKYFEVKKESIKEVWKDIKGWEDIYKISNKGEIYKYPFSIINKDGKTVNHSGYIIKQSINSSNYKKVSLHDGKTSKNYYTHRLLAENFIPNPLSKPEVNHIDGNKWNDNLNNLEWVTKSENSFHAFDTGLRSITQFNKYRVAESGRKFNYKQVEEIKGLLKQGHTKKEIAEIYNVQGSTICNLINGKTYLPVQLDKSAYWKVTLHHLNNLRTLFNETKDIKYFREMIQDLPSAYLQKRTTVTNYAELRNVYKQRHNHKLTEWHKVCNWIESLPYATELITYGLK